MPIVPRRNPDIAPCEVRKSVRNSFGVARTIEVVATVIGVAQAKATIEELTEKLTEEEKNSGIFFSWEYASPKKAGLTK